MGDMNYEEAKQLLVRLRDMNEGWFSDDICDALDTAINAFDTVTQLRGRLDQCNNELCLQCGKYKTQHLGSCNGCIWRL